MPQESAATETHPIMKRLKAFLGSVAVLLVPVDAMTAQPVDSADPLDRARAVQCLSTAIAYEAAYEPVEGQQAVAEVVLNRTRHPAYPKTVCGVVFAGSQRRTGCQFSFTCDGSLARRLPEKVMAIARAIAASALDGGNPARVAGATHYHADYVSPYWAPSLTRITKIGAHIFYRGAGTRDSGILTPSFKPSAEPAIDRLSSADAQIAAPPLAVPRQPVRAKSESTFAPWGLAPTG